MVLVIGVVIGGACERERLQPIEQNYTVVVVDKTMYS
jgi:hypothetical protein